MAKRHINSTLVRRVRWLFLTNKGWAAFITSVRHRVHQYHTGLDLTWRMERLGESCYRETDQGAMNQHWIDKDERDGELYPDWILIQMMRWEQLCFH